MKKLFHNTPPVPGLGQKWIRVFGAAILGSIITCAAVAAEDYPSHSIQVVVPYGPGSADTVPRMAAAVIQKDKGYNFVVENHPGAGGLIGTQYVLRQPADGYHLLMAATNNLVINQFVFVNQHLDPLKELKPVAKLVTVPMIVAVNAKLPINSLKEFVAYQKEGGHKLYFSSPSVGTPPHIAAESLLDALKLKGIHVPYKGGVAMATALARGEVQFAVVAYATLQPFIDSKQIRPLAVVSAERLPALPGVPTVSEAGYPELIKAVLPNWWAITVRAGTSDAIVDEVAGWVKSAMQNPQLQKNYRKMGMVPSYQGPKELSASLPQDAEVWRDMVKRLNIKVE